MKPGTYVTQEEIENAWRELGAFRFATWEFLPDTGDVRVNGKVHYRLSETEAETLKVLINAFPMPVTVKQVIKRMRLTGTYWNSDTVKVIVSRLRARLTPEIIETIPRGYRFNPEAVLG